MKFLADVNIPQSVINFLRQNYEVKDIKDNALSASDTKVIRIAQKEGRIILTKDKDFITLTQYPKYRVPTIVVRLKNQQPKRMIEKLSALLENQTEKILSNSLTLVKEDSAASHPF